MHYQSFHAAQQALDQMHLTPYQRRQAQQLLDERREAMKEQGTELLKRRKQEMTETTSRQVERYESVSEVLDLAADAIDAGEASTRDANLTLANAVKERTQLGAVANAHLERISSFEEPEDPTDYAVREAVNLVSRFPALTRDSRHQSDPLFFPW